MRLYMRCFVTAICLFFPLITVATAQAPDLLIIDNQEVHILANPLEGYLEYYPEKRPSPIIISTALWRGYIATFEIDDNILFLKDVRMQVLKSDGKYGETTLLSVMNTFSANSDCILAWWFTGYLIVPTGELTHYVHMGYGSSYSHYRLFEIHQGFVERQWEADESEYASFRISQFESFKKTIDYIQSFREAKIDQVLDNYEMSDEELESFFFEFSAAYYMTLIYHAKE